LLIGIYDLHGFTRRVTSGDNTRFQVKNSERSV